VPPHRLGRLVGLPESEGFGAGPPPPRGPVSVEAGGATLWAWWCKELDWRSPLPGGRGGVRDTPQEQDAGAGAGAGERRPEDEQER